MGSLLVDAGQAGGDAASEQFHEAGLEIGDLRQGHRSAVMSPLSVERADDLVFAVQYRGRDHGLHCRQAVSCGFRFVGHLPKGFLVLFHAVKDVLTRPPGGIGGLCRGLERFGFPGSFLHEKHTARIKAHHVDGGLRRFLEEVQRIGSALQYGHDVLKPLEHGILVNCGPRRHGPGPNARQSAAARPGRPRHVRKTVQNWAHERRDSDALSAQRQEARQRQLTRAPRGQLGRILQPKRKPVPKIGESNSILGNRFDQHMEPRDRVFFHSGDD